MCDTGHSVKPVNSGITMYNTDVMLQGFLKHLFLHYLLESSQPLCKASAIPFFAEEARTAQRVE